MKAKAFCRHKVKYIVKRMLSVLPFGKQITVLIGNNWVYKRNFGRIKFQGENFQDMIAYMYLPKKKDGFYIDIGANDGLIGNNTYIFEQIGWKGICIEPQPDVFRQYLTKFRNCDCYNAALSSSSNESVEFFQAHGANALSGLNKGMSEDHKNWAKEYGKVEIIKVKTITFDEIMKKYPEIKEIDFMSIDVEGYEMEILKTIDFEKYKFNLITIEKSEPEKIKDIMVKKGYKLFMEIGADIMFIPKNE